MLASIVNISTLPLRFLILSLWLILFASNTIMFIGIIMFLQDVKSGLFAIFYASTLSWCSLGGLILHAYISTTRVILFLEMILSWLVSLYYFTITIVTLFFISLNYNKYSMMDIEQLLYPVLTLILFYFFTFSLTFNCMFARKPSVGEELGRIDLQAMEDSKLETRKIGIQIVLWGLFIVGYCLETIYFIMGAPLIDSREYFVGSWFIRLANGLGTCFLMISVSGMVMNSSFALSSMSPMMKALIHVELLIVWTLPILHVAKTSSIIVSIFGAVKEFDLYYAFWYSYFFSRMYLGVLYFVGAMAISMFHFRELMAQRFREYFIGDVPQDIRDALGDDSLRPQILVQDQQQDDVIN